MNDGHAAFWTIGAPAIVTATAVVSALLIVVLHPLLVRYAVARPNARSSHKVPTPQGGGIAVVSATIAVAYGACYLLHIAFPPAIVFSAVAALACVGVLADIHPANVAPRLLLQALAVAATIYALPAELRAMPILPWWMERVLLAIGALWFVNLVNFMDGLDWMMVAEAVPVAAALAVIGLLGVAPAQNVIVSLALCGAMIGFAYFNRPVARLFLGDVGSLPLGLLLGWLLIVVAGGGGYAAAVLLPLYYVADSSITLLRRLSSGERVWQAHRTHFYQRATDGGFSVIDVVGRVFAINLALCALAIATVIYPGKFNDIIALIIGIAIVAWLLVVFARGKR